MKIDNIKTMFVLVVILGVVVSLSGCLQQDEAPNEEIVPCQVEGINASDRIPGVATITWDVKCPALENSNGTSIAFYKIYKDGEHLKNSEDNQHIDYDVQINEEYTYRVSAVSTEGLEGPKSEAVTVEIAEGMPGV